MVSYGYFQGFKGPRRSPKPGTSSLGLGGAFEVQSPTCCFEGACVGFLWWWVSLFCECCVSLVHVGELLMLVLVI